MRSERRSPVSPAPIAFLDSSGIYALLDRGESHHRDALAVSRSLAASRTKLVLTNFVRAEAHALILNRLGHAPADRFLRDLGTSASNTFVRVTEADEQHALQVVAQYQDKDFSLTDATSFAVTERLGITQVFAFDRDFARYGFELLSAP